MCVCVYVYIYICKYAYIHCVIWSSDILYDELFFFNKINKDPFVSLNP